MTVALLAYAAVLAVCLVAAVYDVRSHRVPNALTYPAIVLGLLFWAVVSGMGWSTPASLGQTPWQVCAVAVAVTAVPFGMLAASGYLGGGDFKLMTAIAALSASWKLVLATSVYALLLAAIGGLLMAAWQRRLGEVVRRLLGAALSGQKPPDAEKSATRVPLALFIALAAAVAGAEHLLGWHSPWAWAGP
ncbi:MAG: A24 family peptidase [Planctomycetota bacterium]